MVFIFNDLSDMNLNIFTGCMQNIFRDLPKQIRLVVQINMWVTSRVLKFGKELHHYKSAKYVY